MKTLYIDTHMFDIHMILFNNSEIVKEQHVIGEKYNSKFLIPTLEKLINNNDFDDIVIVNGPGSFTGVRLGVTIAKTLAYTMNKPIRAISYFDAMNFSLDNGSYKLAYSDGNGYFVSEYNCGKLVNNYFYLNNSEYNDYSLKNTVITEVTIDYEKVLNSVKELSYVNPHGVNPIYVKLIGVEYDKKN